MQQKNQIKKLIKVNNCICPLFVTCEWVHVLNGINI